MDTHKIRISAAVAAAVVVLLIVAMWWALREPDRITVVSWGGDYGNAQSAAMFAPYTDDSGVEVHPALYGGGTAELQRQVESGRLEWDVVDFELPDAQEACRRGWLETIDPVTLPKGDNGAEASADFVPGAIGPCWVASVVYSQVIAFDPSKFAGAAPQRARDFFDLSAFPGGRGMKDAPKGNLELALLATGVAPKDIYALLSSPEGVSRAFAKLDTIRASIVWWKLSAEPIAMLADGRAVMVTALNGKVAEAIAKEHRNLRIIWDGQRYEFDVFGIPRGTLNKDNALDFIRFATDTKRLARISGLLPYGPARRSALMTGTQQVFVVRDARTSPQGDPNATKTWLSGVVERVQADMLAGNPSPTAHLSDGIYVDPNWWAVHGPAIEARWREWRGQP